ncbi:MAG: DUF4111 domain-containing protein [Actinomycetota bacterium]|nr:DUF4111 domain-containing protein [Actinomycetota bacterium]
MTFTPFPELDDVVRELADHAADVLGDDLVGAYVEGSFALGAGDPYSDVDFIVAMKRPLDQRREDRLRAFHRALPARPEHWAQHVEGSYALLDDLGDPTRTGREWLFIDHGHREMTWDTHGNDMVHRWVLREHGIVLRGAPPSAVVAPIEPADLQLEARSELDGLPQSLFSWLNFEIAWAQRYFVITYCRVLFTLVNASVASKPAALRWAARTLDPRWRRLLQQTLDDRTRGFGLTDPPRPGSLDASLAFGSYAHEWAVRHGPKSWPLT